MLEDNNIFIDEFYLGGIPTINDFEPRYSIDKIILKEKELVIY